jgi:hypothetical protein
MAEFFIVLHKSKYATTSPAPLSRAVENIRDAIRSYLAALKKLKWREKLKKIEVAV